MGLLAWTASVRAQGRSAGLCLTNKVTLDLPIAASMATDQSDHAHSVSLFGSPTFVNGQDGSLESALYFNGSSQYANVPADPAFEQMSEAFTIAAWIHPTTMLSENAFLTKLNGSHRNFVFRFQSSGVLNFHFTRTGGLTFVVSDTPVINANQWQHVAATYDGATIKLFLNGQLIKEQQVTEGPTFQSAGSVRVGTLNFGAERIVGYVDDVQMRAFATPDDEVACLMTAQSSIEDGIVMDFPLDNSSVDESFLQNDGIAYLIGVGYDRWGELEQAVTFVNSNSVLVVDHLAAYDDLAAGFTISAWIKPDDVSSSRTIVGKTSPGRDIVFSILNGKLSAHYYLSVPGFIWCQAQTATIVANEWTHVACVWDGTNLSIYQDGQQLQSISPANPPQFTTNDWSIGSLTTSGSENFDGTMDDFKIWERALSICELRSDIHPNRDLLVEDNLNLCPGQNQIVEPIGDLCYTLWTNDNSTNAFFDIVGDDLGVGQHQIVLEAYDRFDHFYSDTVNVTVSLCTGIEESEKDAMMNLYPNPASSIVTVSASDLTRVELLDVSGRLLQVESISNANSFDLNVSTVPAGVYFIRVTRLDGAVVSKRLIKH